MTENNRTLLSNHGQVLFFLANNPTNTIQQIAQRTGLSISGVQKIIVDLENDKFLSRTKIGRTYRYEVDSNNPMFFVWGKEYSIADALGRKEVKNDSYVVNNEVNHKS